MVERFVSRCEKRLKLISSPDFRVTDQPLSSGEVEWRYIVETYRAFLKTIDDDGLSNRTKRKPRPRISLFTFSRLTNKTQFACTRFSCSPVRRDPPVFRGVYKRNSREFGGLSPPNLAKALRKSMKFQNVIFRDKYFV
jgi:hypothetical protein